MVQCHFFVSVSTFFYMTVLLFLFACDLLFELYKVLMFHNAFIGATPLCFDVAAACAGILKLIHSQVLSVEVLYS